jgi:hypothetical protein
VEMNTVGLVLKCLPWKSSIAGDRGSGDLSEGAACQVCQQQNDGGWILVLAVLVECSASSDVAELIILGSGERRD